VTKPAKLGLETGTVYQRIKTLMERLRDPETGCPWDSVQSFETIAPYTIEEAYEVEDAIIRKDMGDLKDELGDLLFQILFHSKMAEEIGAFNLDEVCEHLIEKMVNRHPHIFAQTENAPSADRPNWEDIKAAERIKKKERAIEDGHIPSLLDDVAVNLPALLRAEKLQKRAARSGFDWPDLTGVTDKISEEFEEVKEAISTQNKANIEDEIGDLLFSVTNLARKLKINPETALRRTNRKFTRRFQYIEEQAKSAGRSVSDMDLEEMEAHWQNTKTQ